MLDIGCGIGAITSGIAVAVGLEGRVVGVDRDAGHLNVARGEYSRLSNLTFETGDATSLDYRGEFDIVTAARTLQWIAQPQRAIQGMRQAARAGGVLVVLDYNHTKNQWEPEPPREFLHFYRAFLAWREANGWDNEMAEHLPGMFIEAGLTGVESHPQDEVAERGDADFEGRSAIWGEVIDNVGEQVAGAGFCTPAEVALARNVYREWACTDLLRQTLTLSAVTGYV